jgi:hypothetical protein
MRKILKTQNLLDETKKVKNQEKYNAKIESEKKPEIKKIIIG